MGNSDIYNLSRFIEAQDSCEAFETAIEETIALGVVRISAVKRFRT